MGVMTTLEYQKHWDLCRCFVYVTNNDCIWRVWYDISFITLQSTVKDFFILIIESKINCSDDVQRIKQLDWRARASWLFMILDHRFNQQNTRTI